MTANWQDVARVTLEGSESGAMTFPESVRLLMEAGFDGYAVDFRRSTRTYTGWTARRSRWRRSGWRPWPNASTPP